MTAPTTFPRESTCVAIDGRAILIEGAPGTGKSNLALTLIDRGAELVGDDSVLLEVVEGALIARPHPNTRELFEVRNLGLLTFPCRESARVALVLTLDPNAPRYIESAETIDIGGVTLPLLRIFPESAPPAIKAELALRRYGLD